MGTREDQTFPCPNGHGDVPVRDAYVYRTIFVAGGRQSSKSYSSMSEFCSWLEGIRPWDGSLTAPRGSGRDWGIACQSYTKAVATTIAPYFEQRMGHLILDKVQNSSGNVSHYVIRASDGHGTDRVHLMSYEQYTKAGAESNPFESPRWYGFLWDERMPKGARDLTLRGLIKGRNYGWGRELIAATPWTAAHLYHDVWLCARNQGGEKDHVAAIAFSIHDNPAWSPMEVEEFLSDISPEERPAFEFGLFRGLSGRVFGEFSLDIHVYDDADDHVLIDTSGNPTDWPLAMTVDPHDKRPWAMSWWAIDRNDEWWCVREWPDGREYPYERVRSHRAAGVDGSFEQYAEVIRKIELTIPGGSKRVRWREMDPASGDAIKAGSYDTIAARMSNFGFYFATDALRDLRAGHSAIRQLLTYDTKRAVDALNHPHAHIAESCRNMWWSLNNYTFDEDKDDEKAPREKPRDTGKDFVDGWRYLAVKKKVFHEWRSMDSVLSRQQAQLLAAMKRARM